MTIKEEVLANGFITLENIFSDQEVKNILQVIENKRTANKNFKINNDLFAVRCFLNELPEVKDILMNGNIKRLLSQFGDGYKIVKSIYFDKPIRANWVVNWHQDLTISVREKSLTDGFINWLPKESYFSVQPPKSYLDNILTIRIHLDDCNKSNGALRVLPQSHKELSNTKHLPSDFFEREKTCEVGVGGVLIMKPLIWHSSKRTENSKKRRVIHIEFSNLDLPEPLIWAELADLSM